MRIKTDRRSSLEKSVDRYIDRLLAASGEKNPVRRRVFEKDIHYSLQVIEVFDERYKQTMAYDVYAVDADFSKAVGKVNDAVRTLEKFGLDIPLPAVIEDPNLIEAECVMAFIDSLRSLDAINEDGAEEFVREALDERLHHAASKERQHPQIAKLIYRYIHEKISEEELDKIALEEGYLKVYLKGI